MLCLTQCHPSLCHRVPGRNPLPTLPRVNLSESFGGGRSGRLPLCTTMANEKSGRRKVYDPMKTYFTKTNQALLSQKYYKTIIIVAKSLFLMEYKVCFLLCDIYLLFFQHFYKSGRYHITAIHAVIILASILMEAKMITRTGLRVRDPYSRRNLSIGDR